MVGSAWWAQHGGLSMVGAAWWAQHDGLSTMRSARWAHHDGQRFMLAWLIMTGSNSHCIIQNGLQIAVHYHRITHCA
jgi:hypothetical protein